MTETNHLQKILDLQRNVAMAQAMLKKLFLEALQAIGASRGFLAFEDPNGFLSILVSQGQFWHLPKTEGITGQAFDSGQPVISGKTGAPRGVKAVQVAFSEMAIPIRKGQEVVGAMFFDNTALEDFEFGESHQAIGERYAGEMCDVLERREPWGFRSWWTDHQDRKMKALADTVRNGLRAILRENPQVSGAVFFANGQRHGEPILAADEEPENLLTDPVEDVLSGVASFRNEPRTVAAGYLPFPSTGPVCGYVKVHTMLDSALDESMQQRLRDLVHQVRYDPLAPAAITSQFPEEHFFSLIYDSLAKPDSNRGLHSELEAVGQQVNTLCLAPTRILYRATDFVPVDPNTVQDSAAIPMTSEDLEALLGDPAGTRPHYRRNGHWLSTPVYAGSQLIAVVEIASKKIADEHSSDPTVTNKQSLDDDYNGPFSQSVAVLVQRVYCRYFDTAGSLGDSSDARKL